MGHPSGLIEEVYWGIFLEDPSPLSLLLFRLILVSIGASCGSVVGSVVGFLFFFSFL